MSPDHVAQCAQLAMLVELSSSPKPGNVDRCHDFSDIEFYHFLQSAVSSYPIFRKAALGQEGVGLLILEGVRAWRDWHIRSNTHFGSLVLMIPLAVASAGASNLQDNLRRVLENTTTQDALDFHCAFKIAGARVADVEEFSLQDPELMERLQKSGKTLLDLMRLSQGHDLVAREWTHGYERSFRLSQRLVELTKKYGPNDGVVRAYLEALAQVPDSLVSAKFGEEKARHISIRAQEALRDTTLSAAARLDEELVAEDINPGSTADLIAASLFICLLRGLRF
jgi:triphosphoribosyl-dephospho-CoA synthase